VTPCMTISPTETIIQIEEKEKPGC
jgi:hypothetical protein